ncbi:hypothetical protein [Clostridium chauvoei]|uniref:YbbD head domain-containing protein n=3 Tax=Clostridium chauvoei TaxID=46867 RepID=A0A1U6JMF0_9CLOT|nr:hypothetical protein [Clostridium chauvoei]ATD55720.1 hypothetical protein BTM20_10950 [Clostridium chauvoei]ATD56603.1 hypothetical protein BTM21_02070 [Clostridium chauvoei]MBX7280265.1 hypothetical protein [Clostridium chauvoei]MBX7282750.1 hypothetical protein [Clostridium chauvoei]MBX7285156.1 hypothetical protein [Clostridium chauvoei]
MDLFITGIILYILYITCKATLSIIIYNIEKSNKRKAICWMILSFFMPFYLGFVIFYIKEFTIKQNLNKVKENEGEIYMIKKYKKIIIKIILLSIILLGSGLYTVNKFLDTTYEYNFGNYSEARDIVEKGWIPENMPKDSSDIYNVHNLDTNVSNGFFTVKVEKLNEYKKSLEEINMEDIKDKREINSKAWRKSKEQGNSDSKVIFYGKDKNFYYEITISGKVYYWSIN